MFKKYNIRPLAKEACEMKTSSTKQLTDQTYEYKGIVFRSQKKPEKGDFIVSEGLTQRYLVARDVFHRRYVTEE